MPRYKPLPEICWLTGRGLKQGDGDLLNRMNYSRAEMLHRVCYLMPGSSFREKYAYSNIGIVIAGEAEARADNSSWEEVVSSRILKPLGMDRSVDGFKSATVLIPDKKIGITVMANKQLTVFPEAVRDEFLERYLGATGLDLQGQTHKQQLLWNTLAELPKLPNKPNEPCKDIRAYAGNYLSDAYGIFSVIQNGSNLTIEAGPSHYPGKLQHWSDNTFLLIFPDPDDGQGLINFAIGPLGNITGFDGVEYGFGSMTNYGHFNKI